jgi:hypothetical protein
MPLASVHFLNLSWKYRRGFQAVADIKNSPKRARLKMKLGRPVPIAKLSVNQRCLSELEVLK